MWIVEIRYSSSQGTLLPLTSSDVEDWLDVENNSGVMKAQIEDDILEADTIPTLSNREAPSIDSSGDEQKVSHLLLP